VNGALDDEATRTAALGKVDAFVRGGR